jgi:Zn-finger nucleic acid-binding protein
LIDYCPQCRGVWLDRAELDKIIERSVAAPVSTQRVEREQGIPYYGNDSDDHHHDHHYEGHKKQKSWLQEILD